MSEERLDIVIFGATGFTGKRVVQELHRINKLYEKDNIRWGIAGRSQSKLQTVWDDLQKNDEHLSDIEIIIADVNDEASLKAMCLRSKILLNCCGPYRFYGEAVVKACVESGTHHLDISGEPAYMEKVQLKFNEAAKKAGVYVVSACGFDSVPADLGVVYLQNNFEGDVNSVEGFLNFSMPEGKAKGTVVFNYATWESLIHSLKEVEDLKRVRKQLLPTKIPVGKPLLKDRSTIHKNETDNLWYIPFPGADRAVVNRTQRYFHDTLNKTPIQFKVYSALPSLYYAMLGVFNGILLSILTKYSVGRSLLLKNPLTFSSGLVSQDGLSEENMKHLQFVVRLCGEGRSKENKNSEENDKRIVVEVTGSDPMYGMTAITSIFCALTILKECHNMPETGGVLTPGAAFGNTLLVERLTEHCMNFKVVKHEIIKSKL